MLWSSLVIIIEYIEFGFLNFYIRRFYDFKLVLIINNLLIFNINDLGTRF